MANNRLYVADRLSKEYIFIEKGWGVGWTGECFNSELFVQFISTRIEEGHYSDDTNLFFFTEQSPFYNEIIETYTKITSNND